MGLRRLARLTDHAGKKGLNLCRIGGDTANPHEARLCCSPQRSKTHAGGPRTHVDAALARVGSPGTNATLIPRGLPAPAAKDHGTNATHGVATIRPEGDASTAARDLGAGAHISTTSKEGIAAGSGGRYPKAGPLRGGWAEWPPAAAAPGLTAATLAEEPTLTRSPTGEPPKPGCG